LGNVAYKETLSDGISTKSIPITVHAGSATFKADLRLRVQCGAEAEIDIIGIGAGAAVGIYANIIEFVAVLDSTPTCGLRTREWWDLNVGAYAHLDMVVDFKTIGLVPTVSTTLLNSPTFTQCWLPLSPHETGGSVITRSATTFSISGGPPGYASTVSLPGGGGSGKGSSRTASSSVHATISTVVLPTASRSAGGGAVTTHKTSASASSSGVKFPPSNSTSPPEGGLVTSTVYSTTVYTVTSCAASVVNCPASWQKEIIVTQTVDAFTTVCPSGADITFPTTAKASPTPIASEVPIAAAVHVVTTEVIVLAPCATPVVNTFEPPTTALPPSQHRLTVVMPAPTTATLEVEIKNYWSNSTSEPAAAAPYTSPASKPSGAVVTSPTPVRPTFTAAAGRPVVGFTGPLFAVSGLFLFCGWAVL
jgi:hypothetical protein